jgi:hypothetical protein
LENSFAKEFAAIGCESVRLVGFSTFLFFPDCVTLDAGCVGLEN